MQHVHNADLSLTFISSPVRAHFAIKCQFEQSLANLQPHLFELLLKVWDWRPLAVSVFPLLVACFLLVHEVLDDLREQEGERAQCDIISSFEWSIKSFVRLSNLISLHLYITEFLFIIIKFTIK